GPAPLRPRQVLAKGQKIGVIAQLFENVDGLERLRAFAAKECLDVRAGDEVVVQIQLEFGQAATHNVLVLDRQILGQNVVRPPDDELVDNRQELRKTRVSTHAVLFRCIGVSAAQNGD